MKKNKFSKVTFIITLLISCYTFLFSCSNNKKVHISTKEDLLLLSNGGDFVLDNDIDCEGYSLYGVRDFAGTIDGNGHVLKNVKFIAKDGTNSFGFIANASNKVTIKNFGIENFTINTNLASSNNQVYVGGLIAFSIYGVVIENCYAQGKINVDVNSSKIRVGGFIGYNETFNNYINNSLSDVDINVNLDNSLFESSDICIGGFKGHGGDSSCTMKNDIFIGSINVNSSLEGSIGAKVVVGGLVGDSIVEQESCLSLPTKILCNSWINENIGVFTNIKAGAMVGVKYTVSKFDYCYWCDYDDTNLDEKERAVRCTKRDVQFNSSGINVCIDKSEMLQKSFMTGDYTFVDLSGNTIYCFLDFDESIWNYGYYKEDSCFMNPSLKIFEENN